MTAQNAMLFSTHPETPPRALPPPDDPRYFPADFKEHLDTTLCGPGTDPKIYREYMYSDIARGREIVKVMRAHVDIAGKDVLDVGCGYGGLLIAMKEAGAGSLTGIELEPWRLEWGRKRLESLDYAAKILEMDVCQPGVPATLGSFDIILAQDVIEHVMDLSATIDHMSQMLRPGGAIYVQVGNKFSPDQLLADHHLRLPGITVLSRPQAVEYYCTRMRQPESGYAVGYWRDEKYYGNAFRRRGVDLKRLHRYPTTEYVLAYAAGVSLMCSQLNQDLWPDLRPELGQRMKRRMLKIAELYVHASRQLAVIAAERPEQLEEACDAVTGRMLVPVLRFVGKRKAENEGGGE